MVMSQGTAQEWQIKAACRGPQAAVFYPPTQTERRPEKAERERRAVAICESCSSQNDCRDFAISVREQHGIWGGLTESQRRAIWSSDNN